EWVDQMNYKYGFLYMLTYNWQGSGCGLDFKGKCESKPVQIWQLDTLLNTFLDPPADSCLSEITESAGGTIRTIYQNYLDSIKLALAKAYVDNCFKFKERFLLKYKLNEYQYTLYYYDQAGNLVQTVPPQGVFPLGPSHFNGWGNW